MTDTLPPLTWENSANTRPESSTSLPNAVVSCLENAKYLHLGTCSADLEPHVSLMNYTYLDSHPFASSLPRGPFIIMTTNSLSRKTRNLHANSNVSLLVHDWVSVRPPTTNPRASPPPFSSATAGSQPSGLAALLMDMNSAEMGKISATIKGKASLLTRGSDIEKWCKDQHLRINGLTDTTATTNGGPLSQLSGSPNTSKGFSQAAKQEEEEDVRVVVVRIQGGSIADWKGGVREFVLTGAEGS